MSCQLDSGKDGRGLAMSSPDADTTIRNELLQGYYNPPGSGYLDRVTYRSVHFYGVRLADPLAEAAQYLRRVEETTSRPPYVLCLHQQFSWEDDGSNLAWQVTLVLSIPFADSELIIAL